jgi:hypothetical protein
MLAESLDAEEPVRLAAGRQLDEGRLPWFGAVSRWNISLINRLGPIYSTPICLVCFERNRARMALSTSAMMPEAITTLCFLSDGDSYPQQHGNNSLDSILLTTDQTFIC